jgi:hypothetical protein
LITWSSAVRAGRKEENFSSGDSTSSSGMASQKELYSVESHLFEDRSKNVIGNWQTQKPMNRSVHGE